MCNLVSNGTKVCSSNFPSIPYTLLLQTTTTMSSQKPVVHKDQIISEAIFFGFKSPKKQTKFQKTSALVSKMLSGSFHLRHWQTFMIFDPYLLRSAIFYYYLMANLKNSFGLGESIIGVQKTIIKGFGHYHLARIKG